MPFEKMENLWIWKESTELCHIINELNKEVKGEFELKNQIDRSSQSVPANISEMFGAYYYEIKKQSLRIARREAYETINHIDKFKSRKLWSYDICDKLTGRYKKVIFGINKYIKYLKNKKNDSIEK
ncbi:MAG: four helix bundle protein [Parcubacteria group bacterium]